MSKYLGNKWLYRIMHNSSIKTGNYKKAIDAAKKHPLFEVKDGEVIIKIIKSK